MHTEDRGPHRFGDADAARAALVHDLLHHLDARRARTARQHRQEAEDAVRLRHHRQRAAGPLVVEDLLGRQIAVRLRVDQRELQPVGGPLEADAQLSAHRAARPVGADDERREGPLDHTVRRLQDGGHTGCGADPAGVVHALQGQQADAALHLSAQGLQLLGEDALRLVLRQYPRGVLGGQVERGEVVAVREVAQRPHRARHAEHLVPQPPVLQDVEGPRVDRQRPGDSRRLGQRVDDPDPDPAVEQLAGEEQTGRPRSDDKYIENIGLCAALHRLQLSGFSSRTAVAGRGVGEDSTGSRAPLRKRCPPASGAARAAGPARCRTTA